MNNQLREETKKTAQATRIITMICTTLQFFHLEFDWFYTCIEVAMVTTLFAHVAC